MKQFIYLLGLCLAANFLSAYTPLENIRVVDGDTIRAEAKGKEIKIRLVEIDAPEMNQPFGCLLYTSPSPRDTILSRMPSSA